MLGWATALLSHRSGPPPVKLGSIFFHVVSPPVLTAPTTLSPSVCPAPPPATPQPSLTCPWCSLSCSCTRSRGAGRGSSESHCSHGARWHTHPPGGRTGRPRMPQDVHMLALAPEDTGLHVGHDHVPQTPGPPPPPTSESQIRTTLWFVLCPWPTGLPSSHTLLTVSGTTEATFHAVTTSVLAPPGTPATVGSSQAQGTLCGLSTAQGAALRPSKQPPTASSHTSQGQVGGAQTLSREVRRRETGTGVKHTSQTGPFPPRPHPPWL